MGESSWSGVVMVGASYARPLGLMWQREWVTLSRWGGGRRLVDVVKGMVMPRHAVWLCKDVTCGTKRNQVTSRDLTCNRRLY